MQIANTQGLSLEELRMYIGFENMNEEELEEALQFIHQMTEILIETRK